LASSASRATSVAREAEEANLPYVQGLQVDLVQGQYRVVITPQDQKTVSWTETVTVLPAATLTRTLNLTGLDSSGTPLFNLVVVNKFSATDVEVFEFDTKLKSTDNKTQVNAGETKTFTPHGCAQIYVQATPNSRVLPKNTMVDQFVMSYGHFTRIVGADAANVTITNKVEKRLKDWEAQLLREPERGPVVRLGRRRGAAVGAEGGIAEQPLRLGLQGPLVVRACEPQRSRGERERLRKPVGEQVADAANHFRLRHERQESEYALDIQRGLLPRQIPQVPGFTIAGAWRRRW